MKKKKKKKKKKNHPDVTEGVKRSRVSDLSAVTIDSVNKICTYIYFQIQQDQTHKFSTKLHTHSHTHTYIYKRRAHIICMYKITRQNSLSKLLILFNFKTPFGY